VKRRLKITSGGQVSLPAEIRRRWGVGAVLLEDRGDEVVMRPLPDDPIRAARGIFAGRSKLTTEEIRRREREAEAEIETRKWSSLTPTR
jgi:bifunctional DNA-binding transcriptional regulator/antitoxin component of YhaV-PrlF toxin-antitoxin module